MVKSAIVFILLLFGRIGFAANPYWVSTNGAAAWAAAQSATALTGTAAASMATMNSTASTGMMVNIRDGIYSAVGIVPTKGGDAANRLTIQSSI